MNRASLMFSWCGHRFINRTVYFADTRQLKYTRNAIMCVLRVRVHWYSRILGHMKIIPIPICVKSFIVYVYSMNSMERLHEIWLIAVWFSLASTRCSFAVCEISVSVMHFVGSFAYLHISIGICVTQMRPQRWQPHTCATHFLKFLARW